MNARVLAVGSELLGPLRVDSNSLVIADRLNAAGIAVVGKEVVGDDVGDVSDALRRWIGRVGVVVCTGGLGPTADDVTRDAAAQVFDAPLEVDEVILGGIRARFEQRGLPMPEINRRQAMVPRGAVVLPNRVGTAPGLWLERDGTVVLLLPGPTREMRPILETVIRERLAERTGGVAIYRRVLRIAGRTESQVDERVQPIYATWRSRPTPIETSILAAFGLIELHLTAREIRAEIAEEAFDDAEREIRATLGDAVYSSDGSPLEAVVGALLRDRGWTVALAESCTGGLATSRLTDVPGSSAYVEMACVCYSNLSKVEWLGVPRPLIDEHGAVSEPVARAMAEGVRARAHTAVGIGITGIAGPGGGSPDKPIGTVAIAVIAAGDARVRTFRFLGEREDVKRQAAQTALNMLRLMLVR